MPDGVLQIRGRVGVGNLELSYQNHIIIRDVSLIFLLIFDILNYLLEIIHKIQLVY